MVYRALRLDECPALSAKAFDAQPIYIFYASDIATQRKKDKVSLCQFLNALVNTTRYRNLAVAQDIRDCVAVRWKPTMTHVTQTPTG